MKKAREKRKTTRPTLPGGDWHWTLYERGDLDGAYEALVSSEHFYAYAVRGRIRLVQLQLAEGFPLFEKALHAYERETDPSLIDESRRFFLDLFMHEAFLLEMAVNGYTDELAGNVRTMHEVLRRWGHAEYSLPYAGYQLALATADLAARKYGDASERFGLLHRITRPGGALYTVCFALGAAAGAWGLGNQEEADRFYGEASEDVDEVPSVLVQGIYLARLHALAMLWGRTGDAYEWLGRIEQLPCPERSREYYRDFAVALADGAIRDGRVYLL